MYVLLLMRVFQYSFDETIKAFEINSESVISLFKDDYMKLENVKGYIAWSRKIAAF